MPVPAEEVWRPYSERLQVQLGHVTDQYRVVRGSPGYWRGKRVNTLEKRIRSSIQQTDDIVEQFYSNDLREAFFRGQASVAPEFKDLLPNSEDFLAKMSEASRQRIEIANRRLMRNTETWGDMIRDHPKGQRGLLTKIRNNPVKAAPSNLAEKAYQPGRYPELTIIADTNRAYNLGVLAGAERQNLKYVHISDGPECGLTEHDDPNKADGLVMKVSEAAQYPIAHPHCQRTFIIDEDTRKRKRAGRSSAKKASAARVAVGIGAAATAGMLALRYNKTLQRQLTMFFARNSQEFAAHHARFLQGQVDNSADNLLSEARAAEWAVFYGQDVSSITKKYLRVPERRKVVGLDFDDVTDFDMARRYEIFGSAAMNFENSISRDLFDLIPTQVGNVDLALPRIFSAFPSVGARYRDFNLRFGKVTKFDRDGNPIPGEKLRDFLGFSGSFSRDFKEIFRYGYAKGARNSHGIPYIGIRPHQLVRYRLSKVKHGFANRLVMNPNGMLRAGFAIDPRNGYIVPNLAFIPKGPIRINSYLNRAPGRPTQGVVNTNRLRRALRKSSQGALVDAPLVGMEDVLERGLGEGSGRLRVKDFDPEKLDNLLTVAVPGQAYEDHIIGYAIVRNALEAGEELHDLVIRNGKFQTKVILSTGRITSVSTDIRLLLPKSAVASIRFNTNLRQLGMDSLADIRHLRWKDLRHLPKARTRVVSMALELRAMRYTPLEISKVLRLKYEDVVSMIHDGDTYFLEAGLRTLRANDRFVPARWRADLYEYFTKELDERDTRSVIERLDITQNQLDRIWEKAESSWGRLPYHGELVEDAPLTSELIDTASMILGLTREEIGEVIYVPGMRGLNRADVIRDRAAAVLMKETVRSQPYLAEYWGRAVYTNTPEFIKGYDLGVEYFDEVKERLQMGIYDEGTPYETTLGDLTDEIVADFAAGLGIMRRRFPGFELPDRIYIGGPYAEEAGENAWGAYDPDADIMTINSRAAERWRSFDERSRYYNRLDPEWSATPAHPIGTIVHEFQHVLHLRNPILGADINEGVQEYLLNLKIPGAPAITSTPPKSVLYQRIRLNYPDFATMTDEQLDDLATLSGDELVEGLAGILDEDDARNLFDARYQDLFDLSIMAVESMDDMYYFWNLYLGYNPHMTEIIQDAVSHYAVTDFWEFIAEAGAKDLMGGERSNIPANVSRIMAQTWKEYVGNVPPGAPQGRMVKSEARDVVEGIANGSIEYIDPEDYKIFEANGGTLFEPKIYPMGSPMEAAQDWTLWLEGLLDDEPFRIHRKEASAGTVPELERIRESYDKALRGEQDRLHHGETFVDMMDKAPKTSADLFRGMSITNIDNFVEGTVLDWTSLNSFSEDRYYASDFMDFMDVPGGEPALFQLSAGDGRSFPIWRLLGSSGEEHLVSGSFRIVSKTWDDDLGAYLFVIEQIKDHRGRLT